MPDENELETYLERLWEDHEYDTGGESHGENPIKGHVDS